MIFKALILIIRASNAPIIMYWLRRVYGVRVTTHRNRNVHVIIRNIAVTRLYRESRG